VLGGPFAGMKMLNKGAFGCYLPKLLGIYEKELHGYLNNLDQDAPLNIINIGGAEGYYAVGLARKYAYANIYTYEASDKSRRMIEKLAALNNVESRVHIRETCTAEILKSLLLSNFFDLLICDIEGGERDLFDVSIVALLTNTACIVETHDHKLELASSTLVNIFASSHKITIVPQSDRQVNDYPWNDFIKHTKILVNRYFLSEHRSRSCLWLYLSPQIAA
jgi:hypothetical protein